MSRLFSAQLELRVLWTCQNKVSGKSFVVSVPTVRLRQSSDILTCITSIISASKASESVFISYSLTCVKEIRLELTSSIARQSKSINTLPRNGKPHGPGGKFGAFLLFQKSKISNDTRRSPKQLLTSKAFSNSKSMVVLWAVCFQSPFRFTHLCLLLAHHCKREKKPVKSKQNSRLNSCKARQWQ